MPFSSRAQFDLRPRPVHEVLQERRARGAYVCDLTLSNPTTASLPYDWEAVAEALGDPEGARYAPSPLGTEGARLAVAAYYSDRGVPLHPDQIMLTASTSEGYSYLFKLLCDPGDRVLVPAPSYPLFDYLGALEGARIVPYPLWYDDGWQPDLGRLAELAPHSRALLYVSPNNPTGNFLRPAELDAICELCARHDIALIVDEVFADYPLDPGCVRVRSVAAETRVLSFTLSGLSKVAGLPQVKLGWIVASGPKSDEALQRLDVIGDAYLSVSTPVQLAAARLLEGRGPIASAILDRVRSNWRWLRQAVSGSAVSVLAAEGGWYATLRVPRVRSDEDWAMLLLEEDGVLVHPGGLYGFPEMGYIVVSLLAPVRQFQAGARSLIARVNAAV